MDDGKTTSNERVFYIKTLFVAYAVWIAVFIVVGLCASSLPAHNLTTDIDKRIPLVPEFIWLYVGCYFLPFLAFFALRDWNRFNRLLLCFLFANLTSIIIYLALPVAFQKPELGQSLSERFLSVHYGATFHSGANNFPSMHVSFAWLFYFACRRQRFGRAGDIFLIVVAVMITASTLLVKMHLIVDVVAGMIWAFVAWFLVKYIYPAWSDVELAANRNLMLAFREIAPIVKLLVLLVLFVGGFRLML